MTSARQVDSPLFFKGNGTVMEVFLFGCRGISTTLLRLLLAIARSAGAMGLFVACARLESKWPKNHELRNAIPCDVLKSIFFHMCFVCKPWNSCDISWSWQPLDYRLLFDSNLSLFLSGPTACQKRIKAIPKAILVPLLKGYSHERLPSSLCMCGDVHSKLSAWGKNGANSATYPPHWAIHSM